MGDIKLKLIDSHTPRAASAPNRSVGGKRKTIIVTGGAGFLGSYLCRLLVDASHMVICVDDLSTGRMHNIAPLQGRINFTFIHHDVVNPLSLPGPVDEIYNLACPASPPKYQIDPIHTFKTSVFGAINMLDLAMDKGARILQASTSEVYGDPEISPQPESYTGSVNTVGPRSCYDEGKRAAETLFHDYHARHGVEIRIARIFNTYGPNMSPDDGRVVSNFIMQALRGDDLTVYGTGLQTRSFCYRDDQIAGLMALMAALPGTVMPINIGNPEEFTMLELAQKVLALTESSSRLVFRDLPVDDPRQRRPEITFAKRYLGWQPTIGLDEGLARTTEHFQNELRETDSPALIGAE